jgi:23S rRNA (cytidine1920-2'-O)/16S rRNA (cytidine1409-2'-O)-methyltransferase
MNGQKQKKVRLDRLLASRGLAESRERAQALIIAGQVLVDGQKVEKAGAQVAEDADIRILGEQMRYVSRGGLKLEAALKEFSIDVNGAVALDVGASTGGFTDCLAWGGEGLCRRRGYGQLAWKLRQDPRVVLIERTNIREISPSRIPEPVDLAVFDVSFISLEKVVPPVIRFLRPGAVLIALIKPQFEVGKAHVGKGGIVRDETARSKAVETVRNFIKELELDVKGVIPSPITGQDGNVEYLLCAVRLGADPLAR